MRAKRMAAAVLVAGMVLSSLTGCGSSAKTETGSSADTVNADGTPDLEMWGVNEGYLPVEKGGDVYNFYKDLTGVGIIQPYVEWNGGSNYQQQLNLKISAGEMPDIFLPVNGMEGDLIKNGALLDLTDLLSEKAPHLWNSVPERVWDIVRSYDPTGEKNLRNPGREAVYTLYRYDPPGLAGYARAFHADDTGGICRGIESI